ncbi:hypothetical protein ES708_23115 [subsurface metagenome]
MDKEAQREIVRFLGIAQKIGKDGGYLDVWGNTITLLNQLGQLGYRKLPKDKPPLLSDEEIVEARIENWSKPSGKRIPKDRAIAQAQREADIKFYS